MLQEKIIDDLGMEMDSTSNRLDFVQVIFFQWLCIKYYFSTLLNDMISPFLFLFLSFFHLQKKVAMVMKKASAKGQLMMILFLVVLFIILFVLVFLT